MSLSRGILFSSKNVHIMRLSAAYNQKSRVPFGSFITPTPLPANRALRSSVFGQTKYKLLDPCVFSTEIIVKHESKSADKYPGIERTMWINVKNFMCDFVTTYRR